MSHGGGAEIVRAGAVGLRVAMAAALAAAYAAGAGCGGVVAEDGSPATTATEADIVGGCGASKASAPLFCNDDCTCGPAGYCDSDGGCAAFECYGGAVLTSKGECVSPRPWYEPKSTGSCYGSPPSLV